jgi:hypothetical protein
VNSTDGPKVPRLEPIFRHLDDPDVPWQQVRSVRLSDGTVLGVGKMVGVLRRSALSIAVRTVGCRCHPAATRSPQPARRHGHPAHGQGKSEQSEDDGWSEQCKLANTLLTCRPGRQRTAPDETPIGASLGFSGSSGHDFPSLDLLYSEVQFSP